MEIMKIPLSLVVPSPMNPRKTFEEEALQELADNIEKQGLLQPITVRTITDRSKFNFKFRDGDSNNCSLDNLAISEDSLLLKNMNRFKNLYEKEYYRVFAIVSRRYPEIDRQRILDYVSDGFLRVCGSRQIRDPVGLWVHCATENLWQNLAHEKTVYVAFYPNDTIASGNAGCGLPDIGFLPQYLYDTAMLVYEGFTQKEACDILGVSQACISSRVKKIRQLIAE